MTKLADLDLKIVPVKEQRRMRGAHGLTITHALTGRKTIQLRKRSLEALGTPRAVQLLIAGPYVVIRGCPANAQHARRVTKIGQFPADELIDALGLACGERIVVAGEIDAAHLICAVKDAARQPVTTRPRPVALKAVVA